jgi:hypothetical protein
MKPMILGMVKNDASKEVLDPMYGSGRRLVAIVGRRVFDEYDRMNMLDGNTWRTFGARRRANEVIKKLEGRKVMVLGADVWDALRLPPCQHFQAVDKYGSKWYRVPHPSGLNIMYNDKAVRAQTRDLFKAVVE